MIIDLVEDAVEIKIHFENFTGILQSNYEFAYALGRMQKMMGQPLIEENSLASWKDAVEKQLKDYEPKDYLEENLKKLILEYRMQEQDGEEIQQLYKRGYKKEE